MDIKYKGVTMEFSYIGFTNRLLMIAKRKPITAFSTTVNADQYRCRLAVNDAVQDLAQLLKIKSRLIEFTFSTVSGQRTYVIQKRVTYPFKFLKQKDDDIEITPMISSDFETFIPDDENVGNPEKYYFEESSAVAEQPASAGEVVYSVSDSASDTSQVVIQGYNVAGDYVSDEVTLTGTTAVASSSTFVKIASISKIVTTGTVTFRNLGDTTDFLTLSPKELLRRSAVIAFHPVPSSAITIYGKGWARIPALVNEYDVPVGLDTTHINAIMAGSIFHYMKYDPVIPRDSLGGHKQDYYDEVRKIIGIDISGSPQPHMRSPYWSKRVRKTRI